MKRVKHFGIPFGIFFFLLYCGCANEQSQEEKTRGDITRTIARLSKAVGNYRGVMVQTLDRAVPADLSVIILNNPVNGVDNPMLQGTLNIGLFGGVQIASSSSYFDWGSGNITFSFSRSSPTPPSTSSGTNPPSNRNNNSKDTPQGGSSNQAMEIHAQVLDQGGIGQVSLVTPRQGTFTLNLTRDATSLMTTDVEYDYEWSTPGAKKSMGNAAPPDALLTINLRNQSMVAPQNLDLPFLPGLNASATFTPLGKSPEAASSVIYDPIGGTLELYFTPVSHLWFQNIYLSPSTTGNGLAMMSLNGIILLNSVNKGAIQATRLVPPETLPITPLPQRAYRGSYQGSGVSYRADVYFDYSGRESTNTLEFPFPVFPGMRMRLVECAETEFLRARNLNLVNVDHLNGIVEFQFFGSPNTKDLEMNYTPNWESLEGNLTQGEGIGTRRPHIEISPRGFDGDDCADPPT